MTNALILQTDIGQIGSGIGNLLGEEDVVVFRQFQFVVLVGQIEESGRQQFPVLALHGLVDTFLKHAVRLLGKGLGVVVHAVVVKQITHIHHHHRQKVLIVGLLAVVVGLREVFVGLRVVKVEELIDAGTVVERPCTQLLLGGSVGGTLADNSEARQGLCRLTPSVESTAFLHQLFGRQRAKTVVFNDIIPGRDSQGRCPKQQQDVE